MKAIMIMYDSLNRHLLPNYGCELMKMPNFKRLGEKTVTFDTCYVGSMPCMPARREIHTGRYNFLHRSWGPLEPFDDSMPEILKNNGVHSHLSTDHYHYFEDGGATYHNRYSTWNGFRGQEGDFWKGSIKMPEASQILGLKNIFPEQFRKRREHTGKQDMYNRTFMENEEDFPQAKTFADGIEFINTNLYEDNWFVQIETFDPHEPFFSPDSYQEMYFDPDKPFPVEDWPPYSRVSEDEETIENMKKKYYALATMCDNYLGKVLDLMDEKDMWKDTMLIVNTDHGFLLGEHGWWAKSIMPLYEEIAHTPLFIWDPRCGVKNERRKALVQTIDIAPTILDFFDLPIPKDMQGESLKETIKNDKKVRDYALFGYHSHYINITDGKYIYMRADIYDNGGDSFEYTLMPCHMGEMFKPKEFENMELNEPFSFTKDCKVMKIPAFSYMNGTSKKFGNLLYNVSDDPFQESPLELPEIEEMMIEKMRELMKSSDAPKEQFERVGI